MATITELEQAANLTFLLEEPYFLSAFCSGCRARPEYGECLAWDDPRDDKCLRQFYFEEIEKKLEDTQEKIAELMIEAGCRE